MFTKHLSRLSKTRSLTAVFVLLLFILGASYVYGSTPSFDEQRLVGSGANSTQSVAIGDMNGDGHLDIVIGNRDDPSAVYLNDGSGHFDWAEGDLKFGTGTHDMAFDLEVGDLNGDGYLDIALGSVEAQDTVYMNDGTGLLRGVEPFGTEDAATYGLALGDVDGDGDLDIVAGHTGAPNVVYLNAGGAQGGLQGDFYAGPVVDCVTSPNVHCFGPTSGDQPRSVALGDLDGDGDLDIAVGNTGSALGGSNVIYLNDGSGNFDSGHNLGDTLLDLTWSVALGDVDGDLDLDIVVGNVGPYTGAPGQPNLVYLNDGSASFPITRTFGTGSDWTTSVALGDTDGDGDPDIIAGTGTLGGDAGQNVVYLNDGDGNFDSGCPFGPGSDMTTGVAAGDLNGDGVLDLVTGNLNQPNVVYLSDGGGTFAETGSFGTVRNTASIAVGDMDGNDTLDVVVGNYFYAQSAVYLNDGSGNLGTVHNFGPAGDWINGVAVGDMDGDDDLDIVVASKYHDRLYLNDGYGSFSGSNFGPDSTTESVAVGDVDGDGDLDIVAGKMRVAHDHFGAQDVIYLNDGSGTFTARNLGADQFDTYSVALGDVDGDGDLDVVAGSGRYHIYPKAQNIVYLNDGAGYFDTAHTFGTWMDNTASVALGDMDGDGDLDIVAGNRLEQNVVYLNDGAGNFDTAHTFGTGLDATNSVALGDVDGDGDLDIAIGNGVPFYGLGEQNAVCLNDGQAQFACVRTFGALSGDDMTESVALGDLNGDGTLDLIAGNGGGAGGAVNKVSLNRVGRPEGLASSPPYPVVERPGSTALANFYSSPEILDDLTIPFAYKLFDAEGDPVSSIQAFYSTDGGGHWQPARATTDTVTTSLSTSPTGTDYTFTWDTFASGFFGQSDNVVLRIEVYPGLRPYTHTIPGPYQWTYGADSTFPLRVRGTQVRVISGTQPVANALVYRLPAGASRGGAPIADDAGQPFRTDAQGYLQGRGELNRGDQLVALLPITSTETYVLYYTNGTPTSTGLTGHVVSEPGVQTLTVSADNPLLIFNLDVSVEWDAHQDLAYLEELQYNLQRASEYLYDFSDGQVALGDVNLFQNADEWAYSHVVVNTNNRLRPFAAQGGVVLSDTVDPQHDTISDTIRYNPGQVVMGSTWNRYGRPGQSLGEDWAIILAHELSHYLLFHDDTYIGMDEDGLLVAVDTCLGSAMGDLYSNPGNTEFIADEDYWQANCGNTLAELTLGRYEWETMQLWYPWLEMPSGINSGPSDMPFDFTTVQVHDPYTPTISLLDPTFYIDYQGGGGSSSEARAYLDRGDYLISLGSPYSGQNRVLARGAQVGDRLCVFDRTREQFGCETIETGDDSLAMRLDPTWNPIVQISPVNSTTLIINVANPVPIAYPLQARIFPDLGYGEPPITLTLSGDVYSGTFTLAYPAMSGNIQLWVDEPATESNPRREAIVALSIGGNPGTIRAAGGTIRAAGGTIRAAGGTIRAAGGTIRAAGAPIVSPDGQMIFFTENPIDFAPGTFFTIQTMAGLPDLPPGRTLIGQGYNLVASPGVTLPVGSVSIQYLSNDVLVAGADERDLVLYYWDGGEWLMLDTELNTYFNLASAPSQGEGVYALMASIQIPLYGPGWNLVGYPVRETRPVTEALRSIEGYYTMVKGYDAASHGKPWRLYSPDAPDWVNDLEVLEYAKGYWIRATENITWYVSAAPASAVASSAVIPPPPATYYGSLLAGADFTPTVGMTVTAWVDGHMCGQARTLEVDGQIVYAIHVRAEDAATGAGCGDPGETVTFQVDEPVTPAMGVMMASGVGSHVMFTTVEWDNDQLIEMALSPDWIGRWKTYLPLVISR